jgi:hypothetical protein
MFEFTAAMITYLAIFVFLLVLILPSFRFIGETEVGLVSKRFSWGKLSNDNVIAFNGEAGYQAELLMPGIRFKFWLLYHVEKHPWVQVPAGQIGVVIAQVGSPLPIGAKSAAYKKQFGDFTNLKQFVDNGGQKGVQRPVLSPGTLAPIHPVGFLVITKTKVYGVPVSEEMKHDNHGNLTPDSFKLRPDQLEVKVIEPDKAGDHVIDTVGIVTVFEGDPLPPGDIASRLGGFEDVDKLEHDLKVNDAKLVETLLGSKNNLHNNYQDFQAFLDNGGKIGLQHDPLLYGAYNLNPFLVSVETVPMIVVEQGEVATIKAYVGLQPVDTSGAEFKYGTLVRPGHKGIWQESLRTGKYAINPRCYEATIVPTYILTLNWAKAVSQAHKLDANLSAIDAKSCEGFEFKIDLQVQIHIPDTRAPRVISIVGSMANLVNEVLQAAVGNHFRDRLQSMPAVAFIRDRQKVQEEACAHIRKHLEQYDVETRGVYIQDVIFPEALVTVLKDREIASQRIETYKREKEAQDNRVELERSRGTADMQAQLSKSSVEVDIKKNNAAARTAEGDGEAAYLTAVGTAKGAEVRAVGMAKAEAYEKQVAALGADKTALVNAVIALAENKVWAVPQILSTGGNGSLESLLGVVTQSVAAKTAEAVDKK